MNARRHARLFADLPEAIANTSTFFPAGIHAGRSGIRVSAISRARRRNHDVISAKATREGQPLWAYRLQSEARAPADGEGTGSDRKIQSGGILPHRVGYGALLPRTRHSGARPGSAANSAVCYSLGITAVDPVGMELLFERFSEERGEWPDIDLDLPSGDQRERVIQYVYQRYGKLGAAMTANVSPIAAVWRRAKWARCWDLIGNP